MGRHIITRQVLNGTWDYHCELIVPEDFFPNEFVNGNEEHKANVHIGEINFTMIKENEIYLEGKRTESRHNFTDDTGKGVIKEKLAVPLTTFSQAYCLVHQSKNLVYQYRIDGTNVTGITVVDYEGIIKGKEVMRGLFYYTINPDVIMAAVEGDYKAFEDKKTIGQEWLGLFGNVELVKRK